MAKFKHNNKDGRGDHRVIADLLSQCMNKGGFPRADVPGQQQKPPGVENAVFKDCQGFFVFTAHPEKAWVGTDLKWFGLQAVMLKIHD